MLKHRPTALEERKSFNMEIKPVILLTLTDGVYELMIIDDTGFETLRFESYTEAMLARKAWTDFLNDNVPETSNG